jgi:hypothetical protein
MPLKINGYYQSHLITKIRLNLNLTTVSAVSAEVEIDLQLYMQEKLTRAINKEMNFKLSTKIPVPKKCPGTASYNPTWF